MAGSNRRELYLQVSGGVDGLKGAMAQGRSLINQFGTDAINVLESVERELGQMGTGGAPGLKQIEKGYTDTFRRIRANAQEVLNAPTPAAAAGILDANAGRQAAAAATANAAALRMVAEAASKADAATGGQSAATRQYAVAAATAAVEAEREAAALREQAQVLGQVETQLGQHTTAVTRSTAASGQAKAGFQQLNFQLSDIATQYAMGAKPMQIFAAQSGQLFQALGMIAAGGAAASKGAESAGAASDEAGVDVEGFADKATGLAEKAEGMGGKLGAVAGFMTGPWGAALTVGLAVLTPFISSLFETDEAADKALEGLREFEKQQLDLPNLIDQTTGRLKDQTNALRELGRVAEQVLPSRIAEATAVVGQKQNDALIAANAYTRERLLDRTTGRDIAVERAISGSGGSTKELVEALRRIEASREAPTKEFREMMRLVEDAWASKLIAMQDVRQLQGQQYTLGVLNQGGSILTPESIRQSVRDGMATSAADRAQVDVRKAEVEIDRLGKLPVSAEQQSALARAKANYEAAERALKAAQDTAKTGAVTNFIMPVEGGRISSGFGPRAAPTAGASTFHKGIDIAAPTGTPVRAAAGGVVISAGKLGGLGNAIVIDHGGGTITEYGHLSSILTKAGAKVEQGQNIGAVGSTGISTGPHLDYRVKTGGKYVDPRTGRFRTDDTATDMRANEAAAKAEREAEERESKRRRDQEAFDQLESRAREEQLQLQRQQVTDIAAGADLDAARVEEERKRLNASAQARATEAKDYDAQAQARADTVIALNNQNAELKTLAIRQREQVALIDQQLEVDRRTIQGKLTTLQLEASLATTTAERRRIALQQLEQEERLQRTAAQAKIDKGVRTGDARLVAEGEADRAQVDTDHGLRVKQTTRQNSDKLDQYVAGLKSSTGDMNEALRDVAADGLQGLEDGLVGLIDGTKSVGEAFHDMAMSIISDLVRIAVQKAIVSAIGTSFFGLKDGGLVSDAPGFAGGGLLGGLISGPGTGKSDSILALLSDGRGPVRLSNKEFIVNADAAARHLPLLQAINDNRLPRYATGGPLGDLRYPSIGTRELRSMGSQALHVTTDVNVKSSPLFQTEVERTTLRTVGAAAEPIMLGAKDRTMRDLRRQSLPGGFDS